MRRVTIAGLAAFALIALTSPVHAADVHEVTLTLKDHRFRPDSVQVPAGQRVRIELINLDSALEEFDSEELGVERDVTPRG